MKNLSSLERNTWLDFQKKNTTSYPVKNYLPDSADVILINPANGKQLYWWVSFSRIGFNPSMTQALVLEVIQVRHGALLHDMGKLGVPDHVLHKPDKLTDEVWMIMKKHPQFAYDMLYQIEHLRPALDIPLCHHEKWDGSGYPRGLKEKEIPLPARLFAIVGMWDALTSDRPYRAAWTREAALAHIQEQSGKHFDPEVVELFLKFVAEG